MIVLDLFCCGGGASKGYYDAGFQVVGVDNKPQPKYPFEFILDDALDYLTKHGDEYDLIHASPPCQGFTRLNHIHKKEHPDLLTPIRELLIASGKPYVIENVPEAPLINPIMLCGTMFGLMVIRHRLFECNPPLWFPPATCSHTRRVVKTGRPINPETDYITVTGHFSNVKFAQQAMDIDWLGQKELAQAIPPAYTRWIGTEFKKMWSE